MTANSLTGESTIVLKYDLNPMKPKQTKSVEQEDWVMSILSENKNRFVVSLSNGSATLYDGECKAIHKQELPSEEFVKAAAFIDIGSRSYLVSGCQSGNIYWRPTTESEIKMPTSMCRLDGEAVEAIDANPVNTPLIIVGSSLGRSILVDSSKAQNRNVNLKKGHKVVKTDMRVVEHESASSIHTEAVTAVKWTSANRFASASFDHNVRITDAENYREAWNAYSKDLVPTALGYYPKTNALLVGYDDGYIRLFDEREKSKTAIKLFKSHSKWVSRIAFLPSNPNVFASVASSQPGLL